MSDTNVKRRIDYSVSSFLIDSIDLTITLHPKKTQVVSRLRMRRNPEAFGEDAAADLALDGEDIVLSSVHIDSNITTNYTQTDSKLIIASNALPISSDFELVIASYISPIDNSSLEGLYLSGGSYCTQCEAEGFRKITYFLDRPDVLSIYTCHIISDAKDLPYLLANGNLVSDEILDNGARKVTWHDPHKKPCYLFALVAGDFDLLSQPFTTKSGAEVMLELYVDKGRKSQGQHALDSLVKAMCWDEQTFGLEYDLDVYMIVAVDFFNMGAMENKGLNVFNSKYVLASPETATDQDYFNIEAIIAHEYFHNWTGNRVTCIDWFQLSLKEGLTVFRDQRFSADMFNPLSTRIDQVKVMKEHQFSEDAGPMSHPIRPDEVMEMNNFYTVTVYDKGAEVIRMLHTLLGEQGFRAGMDLYFERHDGQAVTCDDFVFAMQDANDVNLDHFKLWYSQSGTPDIFVSLTEQDDMMVLSFKQQTQPTADQVQKQALYIPIEIEIINHQGDKFEITDSIFTLNKEQATLPLPTAKRDVIPVLLADFSAPVRIHYNYSVMDLLAIIKHSSSDYSKWDASQQLYTKLIKCVYQSLEYQIDEGIWQALRDSCEHLNDRPAVLAELMTVPSIESSMLTIEEVDPLRLLAAKNAFMQTFADALHETVMTHYNAIHTLAYAYDKSQVNHRKLKHSLLLVLAHGSKKIVEESIISRFELADNMTDTLSAIKAAQIFSVDLFERFMSHFEQRYGDDAVVMDKWFSLHANTTRSDILAQLDLLSSHSQYSIKNPNKVRSLVGTFAFYNTQGFHAVDGSGYKYLTDYLIKLDKLNPQIAARMVTALIQWKKFAVINQELMKKQLGRLLNHKGLSKDMFEKVSKSLVNN